MASEFIYIRTIEDCVKQIEALSQFEELAADTETYVLPKYKNMGIGSALDPHTASISLLILRPQEGPTRIFDLIELERADYDRTLLLQLLQSRKTLIYFNARFDVKFLLAYFGVLLRNSCCVRLLAKLIANAVGSKFGRMTGHSLKDVCRDYLGIHMTGKGEEQVSDWYARPDFDNPEDEYATLMWNDKLVYGCGDVEHLFQLREMMLETLTLPLPKTLLIPEGSETGPFGLGMSRVVETEMEMIAVTAEMEYNGLPTSRELLGQIQAAIYDETTGEGELMELASKLCAEFGLEAYPSPWCDYMMPTAPSLKALNNPNKLKSLISQRIGVQLDNVQASVLERMIDLLDELGKTGEVEFVDEDEAELFGELRMLEESVVMQTCDLARLVVKYKQLEKQRAMNLLKYINPVTGAICSNFDQLGAATGRSSAARPNSQQISGRVKVTVERSLDNLFPPPAPEVNEKECNQTTYSYPQI